MGLLKKLKKTKKKLLGGSKLVQAADKVMYQAASPTLKGILNKYGSDYGLPGGMTAEQLRLKAMSGEQLTEEEQAVVGPGYAWNVDPVEGMSYADYVKLRVQQQQNPYEDVFAQYRGQGAAPQYLQQPGQQNSPQQPNVDFNALQSNPQFMQLVQQFLGQNNQQQTNAPAPNSFGGTTNILDYYQNNK